MASNAADEILAINARLKEISQEMRLVSSRKRKCTAREQKSRHIIQHAQAAQSRRCAHVAGFDGYLTIKRAQQTD